MHRLKSLILAIATLVLLGGCSKNDEQIPNVSFSATVYLNDPAMTNNPVVIRQDAAGRRIGISGVILYRVSPAEFYAFDLMCPHERTLNCEVALDDGASATCKCCGSMFLIATGDGAVLKGPASWPLKSYNCRVSGNYLNIWN
jgi:nitrite reductase/ring-hydroxylating ferredoxin subunit